MKTYVNFKSFFDIELPKIFLVLMFLLFVLLFCENFIFSDSFALLHLREVDDLAFHTTLRNIHRDISAFHFDGLLKLNDYGYGWIFWIVNGILTYPFYLLAVLTDFYVPLIVLPRMVSMFCVFGAAFFTYKILCTYSKNEFLKVVAMFLLLCFPAFSHFGLRFSTVAPVMCFSSLAFYLTIRKETYDAKDLKQIALAAGLCAGCKLNGVLIMPLIGLIMASRLQWRFNKENAKKAGYFSAWFLLFTVLFSNPSLFLSPFRPKYFFNYVESLKYNSHLALQDNFYQTFRDVIEVGYINFYIAFGLFLIALPNIFSKEKKRKDLALISIWLIVCLSLLAKIMAMGSLYIINYVLVVMYLMIVLILVLEKWGRIGEFAAVGIVVVNILLSFQNIYAGFYSNLKYFHLLRNPDIISKIVVSEAIKKLILDPKDHPDKKINVIMDFRAIFPYAHLERDNLDVQFVFDNFQIMQKQNGGNFEYISISRESPFFYSEEKFSDFIKGFKDESLITNQVESRKIIQNLIKTGYFNNVQYQQLLDQNGIIFFAKK